MGRMYTVPFSNVSVSAAQDLFAIQPADDKPVRIHLAKVRNVGGTADAGDAQEELLSVNVIRGFTSLGSGGTAPTPVPCNPSDAAAGFTAHVNDTTPASGGTGTVVDADGFNVRTGYDLIPTPEMQISASQGQTTIVVKLVNAPADAVTMSGTLYVEEHG